MTPAITQWWDSLPDHDRLPFYSPAAIEASIGHPMEDLAAALRALGWQRVQVRIVGIATIVWVAPGERSPLRARGRPPKPNHTARKGVPTA